MTAETDTGRPLFSLDGKNIIVTGGGYGLGRAMARGLARSGANVMIAGRTRSRLAETAEELRRDGGSVSHCVFDATRKDSCDSMAAAAADEFGSLDGIVINHGVIAAAAPEELDEAQWRSVIDTNLTGCFYCARAAAAQLIAQGRGGSIVMISSNGSLVAFDGLTAYGASKGGVDMMCRQMAAEWGRYNIRVNTVNPGYTTHPMGAEYEIRTTPELENEIKKWTPLGRRGTPEDIVGPVIFLCAEASGFVSGISLVVDGGYTVR